VSDRTPIDGNDLAHSTSSVRYLRDWFLAHLEHPFPTSDEKASLCASVGISVGQINGWCVRAALFSARSSGASFCSGRPLISAAELTRRRAPPSPARSRMINMRRRSVRLSASRLCCQCRQLADLLAFVDARPLTLARPCRLLTGLDLDRARDRRRLARPHARARPML
jgi:hypothetical protein